MDGLFTLRSSPGGGVEVEMGGRERIFFADPQRGAQEYARAAEERHVMTQMFSVELEDAVAAALKRESSAQTLRTVCPCEDMYCPFTA